MGNIYEEEIRKDLEERLLEGTPEEVGNDLARQIALLDKKRDEVDPSNSKEFSRIIELSNKYKSALEILEKSLFEKLNTDEVAEFMNIDEVQSLRDSTLGINKGVYGKDLLNGREVLLYPAFLFPESAKDKFLLNTGHGKAKYSVSPSDFIIFYFEKDREDGKLKKDDIFVVNVDQINISEPVHNINNDAIFPVFTIDENPPLMYHKLGNTLHFTNKDLFEKYTTQINGLPEIVFTSERLGELSEAFPVAYSLAGVINDYFTGADDADNLKIKYELSQSDILAFDVLKSSLYRTDKVMPTDVFHDYTDSIQAVIEGESREEVATNVLHHLINVDICKFFDHTMPYELREGINLANDYFSHLPGYVVVKQALEEKGFNERSVGKNKEFDDINENLNRLMQIDTKKMEYIFNNLFDTFSISSPISLMENGLSRALSDTLYDKQAMGRAFTQREIDAFFDLALIFKNENKKMQTVNLISLFDSDGKSVSEENINIALFEASRFLVRSSFPPVPVFKEEESLEVELVNAPSANKNPSTGCFLNNFKYILFNEEIYTVDIKRNDEKIKISIFNKDGKDGEDNIIAFSEISRNSIEMFISNEIDEVIEESDSFEEIISSSDDFNDEESFVAAYPNKLLSADEKDKLIAIRDVVENKSIAYCLEWIKSNKRQVGFGRLLLEISHLTILQDEKENVNDCFVYTNSCSFGVSDHTKLNNASLDLFYEKSGFEPFLKYHNGATLMFIPKIENFKFKNNIVFYDDVHHAKLALDESLIDVENVKISKTKKQTKSILQKR